MRSVTDVLRKASRAAGGFEHVRVKAKRGSSYDISRRVDYHVFKVTFSQSRDDRAQVSKTRGRSHSRSDTGLP